MSAVASDELPPFGGLWEVLNLAALVLRPMPNWVFSPKFPLEAGVGSHGLLHTFRYL